MESIRAIHPELPVITILVDEIDGYFDPSTEPFQTLLASDLGIPRWRHFSMKYDIMELNTAVKPYAIQYLMEKFDAKRVIYFDPDILVYNPLDHIFGLLDTHLCVLTPHITSPLNDDFSPSEVDFLKVGTYNLGFFAISQNGNWNSLLGWWQDRLYEDCTREVERGLFVDQHWMDLVPSLFASAYVLREPEYNVAYWNLSHRQLEFSINDGYTVNGRPLCFFHFSGFSVKNPETVSKHQNRFHFGNLNEATRACYLDYRRRLLDCGFEETSKYPYAYGHFDNGVPITDVLRICLRNQDSKGEIWPDPYLLDSPDCFLGWATTPGMLPPYNILSPYAVTLYKTRADLIASFPELQNHIEINFASWFVTQRLPADVFAPAYLDPVRDALDRGGIEVPAASRFSVPSRRERLARAVRYYRNYPTQVKPYLPPTAFTEPSVQFTGPMNAYGRTRNALQRMGVLRASKRIVGMRLVMTAREYFNVAPIMRLSGSNAVTGLASEITYGATVVGYLRAETGVGQIARNLISCLKEVKFPVAGYTLNVGDTYRQRDESVSELTAPANHFVQLFAVNADQSAIVRNSLGGKFYDRHYNIGYWFWELSDFPEIWKAAFEIYDEIWVATKFVQDAAQAKSTKPVFCIPPAISIDLPEQSSRAQFGLSDDDFVVLFVFDALSVVERKNPWAVVRAFELAFTEEERHSNVRLMIKVTNLDRVPESARLRAEVARVNGIIIDGYLDRIEVNALIDHCDVYISLHRSEGYGLTMAEAMYLGKPVIGTAYSGNIDFMNDENSYPVPFKIVELGRTYPPYEAHNVWAEPDVESASRYLREIYDDPVSAKAKGEAAARFIREHYSFEARGKKIAERLNDICIRYFSPEADADGYDSQH
jgi:glycosyltransferase involved in cell wall biosynthesis